MQMVLMTSTLCVIVEKGFDGDCLRSKLSMEGDLLFSLKILWLMQSKSKGLDHGFLFHDREI